MASRKRKREAHEDPQALVTDRYSVLKSFYPSVDTLRGYLLKTITSKTKRRRISNIENYDATTQNDASTSLLRLLDTLIIGWTPQNRARAVHEQRHKEFLEYSQKASLISESSLSKGDVSHAELLDFAIWQLFFRRFREVQRPTHLLCHGLVRASQAMGALKPSHIQDLSVLHENRHLAVLKGPAWQSLMDILGTTAAATLLDLLIDCAVFEPITGGKNNLRQVSGLPMHDLTVLNGDKPSELAPKRQKRKDLHSLSSITFVKSRMLYGRPSLNGSGQVRLGYRHVHPLNRHSDASDDAQTINLMRYIFPRQFGLHNVFTSVVDKSETTQMFKDYTSREKEIAALLRRKKSASPRLHLPKRLQRVVGLVKRMQRLHGRCAYAALVRHYCPNVLQEAGEKSAMVDAATPLHQVVALCLAVLRSIIPRDMLGSGATQAKNWGLLTQNVKTFISCRRFENITLHSCLQGLALSHIAWLGPSTKLSQSDFHKRHELLAELVYFIFDSLLIPLLRNTFYITESTEFKNRLLFFRHETWKSLAEPRINEIRTRTFDELSPSTAQKIIASRRLGFSQMRFLPKKDGLRPITNLKRRVAYKKGGKTVLGAAINSSLKPIFAMLNFEKRVDPSRLGASMFSVSDLAAKIRAFKSTLNGEKLYFAKVDVQSCFDTIPQERLHGLIARICRERVYAIRRQVEVRGSNVTGENAKPSRKFLTLGEALSGEDEIECEGKGKYGTVFIEKGNKDMRSRHELLGLLEQHVKRNVVKIGRKFYVQKTGIPQGSVVSSLLCNYFYADFEARCLDFIDLKETLLARMIDDFLIISTSQATVTRFLTIMMRGNADYGIGIKRKKSVANFRVRIDGFDVPVTNGAFTFPFCKVLIDTRTLELSKERTRETKKGLKDGMTIESSKKPGGAFHRKVLNLCLLNMASMFTDTSLNSLSTVLRSLWENLCDVAEKTHVYISTLERSGRGVSDRVVIRTIVSLGDLVGGLLRSKRRKELCERYSCQVSRRSVELLVTGAFERCFSKRRDRYESILGWLRERRDGGNGKKGRRQLEVLEGIMRRGTT